MKQENIRLCCLRITKLFSCLFSFWVQLHPFLFLKFRSTDVIFEWLKSKYIRNQHYNIEAEVQNMNIRSITIRDNKIVSELVIEQLSLLVGNTIFQYRKHLLFFPLSQREGL
jgi:hypothetical protein